MVTANTDSLLSPKGVNYDGMCHEGLKKTKNMSCLSSSLVICSFIYIFLICFLCTESVIFFYEAVAALMVVKSKMKDELHVLNGWDINSVDPCSWNMIACSAEGFVVSL